MSKRTTEIDQRRERVAVLVQKGTTQTKIAGDLDVSIGTVRTDVAALKREGRDSNIPDGDLARKYIDSVWDWLHEQFDDLDPTTVAEGGDYVEGAIDALADLAARLKWQELADRFKELKR